MPIHDWTRVEAGIFHGFHTTWLGQLSERLNAGVLPPDFYALPEQIAADYVADVLTLRTGDAPTPGGTAVAPATRFREVAALRRRPRLPMRHLAVKHVSHDQTVAVVELVSPGNKSDRRAARAFVQKSAALVQMRVHLVVVDLFPPTPRDPRGIHAAIWKELTGKRSAPPPDKPLTQVSYEAGSRPTAHIEPAAVGDRLTDLPLFLAEDWSVPLPLEAAYIAAFAAFPARWRRVLEA